MNLKGQYNEWKVTLAKKENEIARLRANNQGNSNRCRELREEVKEIQTTMKDLKHEAYLLMEKLMSEMYANAWKEVVKQQCKTQPYVNLDGKEERQAWQDV